MRNRDLLQNWMRKNAVALIDNVQQSAEDIGHGLDETGKGLQEVGKGTQQLATTGDKLSETGDRAIVLGDRVVDRYDKAVSYLPWIGTGLFGGGLLGALMGGKKHTLLGSVIGATGGATAAGIAKYLYDKHKMNKQASADECDRRARLHYKLYSR